MPDLFSLMMDDISAMRKREQNFSNGSMRWRNYWFSKTDGIIYASSKKERSALQPIIRLGETTTMDFALLNNAAFFESYKILFRQQMKQM